MVLQFLMRIFLPLHPIPQIGSARYRAMRTLAGGLGKLSAGDVGGASDILMCRFKSLQQEAIDGNDSAARWLELIPHCDTGMSLSGEDEELTHDLEAREPKRRRLLTGRGQGFGRSASTLGVGAGGRDLTSETDGHRGTVPTNLPAGAGAPARSRGGEAGRGSARRRARSGSCAGSVGAPAQSGSAGGASQSVPPASTLPVDGEPLAAGEGLPAGRPQLSARWAQLRDQFPKKPGENAQQWKRRIHRVGGRPGGSARAVLRPSPPPGNR